VGILDAVGAVGSKFKGYVAEQRARFADESKIYKEGSARLKQIDQRLGEINQAWRRPGASDANDAEAGALEREKATLKPRVDQAAQYIASRAGGP
jgi:hypothetical protein